MIIMLNQMDDEDAYRQSHQPSSQTYVVAATLSFSIHTVCQFDTRLVMSILNGRREDAGPPMADYEEANI